jgi:hypothetical protein
MSLTPDALVDDQALVHPDFFDDSPQGEHLVIRLISPPDGFAEGVRRAAKRIAARTPAKAD